MIITVIFSSHDPHSLLQQAPISSYLAPGASAQQAEARDGGGHHGHHAAHGHDEHHHVEHAAAAPVSSIGIIDFGGHESRSEYFWTILSKTAFRMYSQLCFKSFEI